MRLSRKEEMGLGRRIERGDISARNRLVECNQGLVWHVAQRYFCPSLEVRDLAQEGNIGLIRAAERWDWRRGLRFSTYAMAWVRGSILEAITNKGRIVRAPARHKWPAVEDCDIASLHDPMDDGQVLFDRRGELTGMLAGLDLRAACDRAFCLLSPRQAHVLRMRFGLEGEGQEHTLKEIARHFGFSRERARQIENEALRKLRQKAHVFGGLSDIGS